MSEVDTSKTDNAELPTSHKFAKTLVSAGAAFIATALVDVAFQKIANRRTTKTEETPES